MSFCIGNYKYSQNISDYETEWVEENAKTCAELHSELKARNSSIDFCPLGHSELFDKSAFLYCSVQQPASYVIKIFEKMTLSFFCDIFDCE